MRLRRRVLTKCHHPGRTRSISSSPSKKSKSFPVKLSREQSCCQRSHTSSCLPLFCCCLSLSLLFASFSVTEVIGSGHFGEVDRGQWKSVKKNSTLDVALKTLPQDRATEDKLKLLQEAMIMGQFSHPNIVQLYGIVSYGEPVSQQAGIKLAL